MTDFGDLYMEVILDHNKNPRNKGEIENQTNHADGHNPLCGDKISLDLIPSSPMAMLTAVTILSYMSCFLKSCTFIISTNYIRKGLYHYYQELFYNQLKNLDLVVYILLLFPLDIVVPQRIHLPQHNLYNYF